MTIESSIVFFTRLSAPAKQHLLTKLGFQLTIEACSTYTVGEDDVDDPVRLRRFNEVQHRILGFKSALSNGAARYPDEIFVHMILEHEDNDVKKVFERVLEDAMK